jgi:predicted NBD/HSP70 family sugar kinase
MYIVADIGATKTRIAESRDLKHFGTPVIADTLSKYEDALHYLSSVVRRIAAGEILEGAVVGKPKPLWAGKDFAGQLGKLINSPVTLENDTALVGLGEAHYGAGKGSDIFVYITVSTGVGGVRIVGGKIDVSAQGFEIGGQYLATEGTIPFEDLISGSAIHKHYGVHPKELGKEHPVWEEEARLLAYGLHNTILHWSPQRVAIGGSMMNEIGIPVERVRFHLEKIMKKFPTLPEIVHSELGDVGGLWGALARLRQLNASSRAAAYTLPRL